MQAQSKRSVHLYGWSIVLMTVLFVVLVLIPFYGNNIKDLFTQIQPGQDLPKDITNFAPYSWDNGILISELSILILFFVPVYVLPFSIRLLWILYTQKSVTKNHKMIWTIIIAICLLILLITTPDWGKIGYWLAD